MQPMMEKCFVESQWIPRLDSDRAAYEVEAKEGIRKLF